MKYALVFLLCLSNVTVRAQRVKQGLLAQYYEGTNFKKKVAARIDKQIDFQWNKENISALGLKSEHFSIRWTGRIYAPITGTYYFSFTNNANIRFWINGMSVLDNWVNSAKLNKQMPFELINQRISFNLLGRRWYNIKVEYYILNRSNVTFYWELPYENQSQLGIKGIFKKAVPAQNFTHIDNSNFLLKKSTKILKISKDADSLKNKTLNVEKKYHTNNIHKDMAPIPKINFEIGKNIVLNELQFDQSSYSLLDRSYSTLEQLTSFLLKNIYLNIDIIGHTDNQGDSKLNLTLSEYRARQVANYLLKSGIEARRIKINAYGEKYPISDNTFEEGRAKNRRVEIILYSPPPF